MFKRGFKTWCERVALEKRAALGLKPNDPLDPKLLATNMGVQVWEPAQVPGLSKDCLRTLLHEGRDSWSAVTLRLGKVDLVIVNSAHSRARQASDLMHELAHILLGHSPTRVDVTEDQQLLLRTHDRNQEDEANWLAGCLLLPRDAVLGIRRRDEAVDQAARTYGVSFDMLTYRIRMTGADIQTRRARQRPSSSRR